MVNRWLMLFKILVSLVATLTCAVVHAETPDRQQLAFFEKEVRPLLVAHCQKCHGEKKKSGGLRLDSLAGMIQGGESGEAIVPHKPSESLLVEAIKYESLEMPPKGKLPDDAVATIEKWIEIGAPWPNVDVSKIDARGGKFTDEDRSYWAFQPLRHTTPPQNKDDDFSRNPIDQFVLARLRRENLRPADEASKRALLRRATFDLTGLPPTPKQTTNFLEDDSPRAYQKLIEQLLDSPQYGERWARHWLDLVRYAESDGYKQDAYRPNAWLYRDYVIRSFNNDKPYDRFVMEQLAGDEIAPDDPDALAATAYLRHWIYEYNQRDVRTQWHGILNDVTDVTADVFLGLGMGCARCHDHKFDPILRKDYYRLQAFFAAISPQDDVPIAATEKLAEYKEQQRAWESATTTIREQLEKIEEPIYKRAEQPAIDKFPPDIRPMMRKAAHERAPLEEQLASMAFRQVVAERAKVKMGDKLKGDVKTKWERLKVELAKFDHLKPKKPTTTFTVSDVGPVAPVVFIPGRTSNPIAPGFLSIMDPEPANIEAAADPNTTGRRTTLAKWIASADNPLATRVIVNRVWQYHFGKGLVGTSSDFGRLGEPPTHPDLLDWLTRYFLEHDWSIKELHRVIMTSATYRQASTSKHTKEASLIDPTNRLLWRGNIRRLDAEQIRDAMLSASGELNFEAGGPSAEWTSRRRSVYLQVKRNSYEELLRAFDGPDNFSSLSERNTTTIPTQALLLINGDWTLARASAFAKQLAPSRNDEDASRDAVSKAFQRVYARTPEDDEVTASLEFIRSQQLSAKVDKEAVGATSLPRRRDRAARIDPNDATTLWQLPQHDSLPRGDFTVEATIMLRSLYPNATVRTIVSHWDSSTANPGWALGVTSTKSAYKPRNLILQLVGDPKKGGQGYEVIASNLRPELNKPYYVAVSVDLDDTSESGVTFYLKDLSTPDSKLQIAHRKHKVTKHYRSPGSLVVGGRDKSKTHRWDGLIDDLRISETRRSHEQLLLKNRATSQQSVVGFWSFNDEDQGRDTSASGNNLQPLSDNAMTNDPWQQAWVDFCHVLLNSNEFIYID